MKYFYYFYKLYLFFFIIFCGLEKDQILGRNVDQKNELNNIITIPERSFIYLPNLKLPVTPIFNIVNEYLLFEYQLFNIHFSPCTCMMSLEKHIVLSTVFFNNNYSCPLSQTATCTLRKNKNTKRE